MSKSINFQNAQEGVVRMSTWSRFMHKFQCIRRLELALAKTDKQQHLFGVLYFSEEKLHYC